MGVQMTASPPITVSDMHVAALGAFLAEGPDILMERYGEEIKAETRSGFSLLIYYAFARAARLKFSPTYTFPQVIRYVADLRLLLGEDAHEVDPRAAEGLIRFSLGDKTFSGRPPFGVDQLTMLRAELHLLVALMSDAELDETELEEFIEDAAALAREWCAAQQGEGPNL